MIYKSLPDADITCLDYSADMMATAQHRAKKMDLGNVQFRQGDVGKLPFADGSFDLVLSLNGFHAFPDKEAAYRETYRVSMKEIQEWLGHSDFSTTANTYAHLDTKSKNTSAAKMTGAFQINPGIRASL